MRRRIFNLAASLSLLLCAATVVLWVRGASNRMQLILDRHGGKWAIYVYKGRFGVDNWPTVEDHIMERARKQRLLVTQFRALPVRSKEDLAVRNRLRAEIAAVNVSPGPRLIRHALPLWSVVLCLLMLPVTGAARFVRNRRRAARDQCSTCGYSLTGNTSGTCPECGTPISQRLSAMTTDALPLDQT